MRTLLLVNLLATPLFVSSRQNDPPQHRLKYEHSRSLKNIPEPSGIAFDSTTSHCFIVSDHGKLFECDHDGNILRKAQNEGIDFEGVEVKDSFIYVSDEAPRMIYKYRKSDLSLTKQYSVSWDGAMNKAFESITYNYSKKRFIMVSQSPVNIIEYNEDFKELNRYPFHKARSISEARWYGSYIYLLSALDETIYKCNPLTYEVKESYKINVFNAEGLAFDKVGNVIVTSDDFQRIYFFKNLPHTIKQ